MNILFITGEYPPQQGGVGAYTAELGHALIDLGLRVHVLTSQTTAGDLSPTVLDSSNAAIAPVVYPLVQKWSWMTPAIIRNVANQVNADWIHVQYQTAAFGMNPIINFIPHWWQTIASPQPAPTRPAPPNIAWTYHDLLVPYLFPKAGDRIRRWITEHPARSSDLTITTNLGDHQQLTARQPDSVQALANIPIGSNIIGQKLSSEERVDRRHLRGYTNQNFVIAYFGFLNRSKGGITLIETLHHVTQTHPNARLLMIGERVGASDPTNYAYLQEVEARIESLGLSDKVQWTGRQENAEVSADLAASDLLFMPYEDGASLRRGTLMAGLINHCAIVTTTPQAPLPELVHERDLLYVPPRDPEAAANAIRRLISDPIIDMLRRNAGERSQLFSWQKIAKQHQTLYKNHRSPPAS